VRKVTIAGALVASGADLTETVPRAEVERFVLSGLAYGADLDPVRPTLQQLLDAMISVSDNASADALLARVGPRAADRWARRGGLAHEDPIMPLLGEFGSWGIDPSWDRRSPAARAARAIRLARTETGTTVRIPGVATQRRFARVSVRGTPAEWAGLMRTIGRRGDPALVAALDWPRRAPAVAADYDRYLAKGGNLPGVITEAQYLRPAGGTGTAAALFFRDLPADVERVLTTQFPQQELLRRIAGDPSFARRVARALRG
jgi:beta-lactamase class A